MINVINRLRTNKEEIEYIRSEDQVTEEMMRFADSYKIELRPELRAELRPIIREEVKEEVHEEVRKQVKDILKLYLQGKNAAEIAEILNIPIVIVHKTL